MKEDIFSEIQDLLWEIRQLTGIIEKYAPGNDPMDKLMESQFRHRQQTRLERLFVAIAKSKWKFVQKGRFLRQLATYLEKTEQGEKLPASSLEPEWKGIDRLLAAKQMAA